MRTGSEHDRDDAGSVAASSTPNETADPTLDFDRDGHGPFRDMCLVYGDVNRPVFLQEIINWFVRSANKDELAALRRAMALRSGDVRKGGKRGRPRAWDDSDWLMRVKTDAWRRIVEGRSWRNIAEYEGLKPNRTNIRTIERTRTRRQDEYAAKIWDAAVQADVWRCSAALESNLRRLDEAMNTPRFRQWLWVKAGLFGPRSNNEWTEGCRKIVLALAPRGGRAAGAELVHAMRYRKKRREHSPS